MNNSGIKSGSIVKTRCHTLLRSALYYTISIIVNGIIKKHLKDRSVLRISIVKEWFKVYKEIN